MVKAGKGLGSLVGQALSRATTIAEHTRTPTEQSPKHARPEQECSSGLTANFAFPEQGSGFNSTSREALKHNN